MEGRKLYRANALLTFSMLDLPWTVTNEKGEKVPVRLEDPPVDSDQIVGFLPIFGNKEAAEKWSNGRFGVEEVALRPQAPVMQPRQPAYATVAPPPALPVRAPQDNTITVDPNAKRPGRRRGRR